MPSIFVTGGLGFIGSHTCVKLLEEDQHIVILDNLSNAKPEVADKLRALVPDTKGSLRVYKGDIQDKQLLNHIFQTYSIECVIHFAGLKSVAESIHNPLEYYTTNVCGTLCLLEVMKSHNCYQMIFSSSATVYGNANYPVSEGALTGFGITNPYGHTKHMIEQILRDLCKSDEKWRIICLRYFNPVGAHSSGLLGEDPNDIPNNLMPILLDAVIGKREHLTVFGTKHSTRDGTCIRDFIHVDDLAKGHICAISYIRQSQSNGFHPFNLGTGMGTSVKELLDMFETVNRVHIPRVDGAPRPGDLPVVYANVEKAERILNFRCEKTLEDMYRDAYRYRIKSQV